MEKLFDALRKFQWIHALLIAGAYGGYTFYFQDTSEVDQRKTQLRVVKNNIKNTNVQIQQAEKFEIEYENKKRDLATLEEKLRKKRTELPRTFDIPGLLTILFNEAEQIGLEIIRVVPDANEKKTELFASLKIEIDSRGTFLQIFIFLDRLSKLKKLVGVTRVLMNTGSGTISLKGTTGALSRKTLTGGDKAYTAVTAKIILLAYRVN